MVKSLFPTCLCPLPSTRAAAGSADLGLQHGECPAPLGWRVDSGNSDPSLHFTNRAHRFSLRRISRLFTFFRYRKNDSSHKPTPPLLPLLRQPAPTRAPQEQAYPPCLQSGSGRQPRGRTPPARPRDRAVGNGPHAPCGTRPGPRAWPNGSFRPPKVKAPSATEGPRRCPLPCPPRQAGLAALLTRKAAARAAPQLVSHTGTSGTYARSHPALSSRQIICRSTFVFRQKAQTSRSEVSKPQVRLF